MNAVQRIAKNSALLFTARILAALVNLAFFASVARYLGANEFGVLAFTLAFASIFAVLGDLGLDLTTVKAIARQKVLTRKYVGNVVVIKSILSVVILSLVTITIVAMGYPRQTVFTVCLVAISYIVNNFVNTWYAVFQAHERIEFVSLGYVLQSVILFSGAWLMISRHFGLVSLAVAYVIASLTTLGYCFLSGLRLVAIPRLEIDWQFWKTTLRQALPIGISTIFCAVYAWISSVMLSRMAGDEAVAWYNSAFRLSTAISLMPIVFFTGMFPVMSRLHQSSASLVKFAYQRSFKYMLMLAVPIAVGTIFLAQRIIYLILGQEYTSATLALQLLVWSNVFIFLNQVSYNLLNAINKQIEGTKGAGIGAAINIGLNLLLIPWLGYIGAAITSIVTEFVVLVFFWTRHARLGYGMDGQVPILGCKIAAASIGMGVFVGYFRFLSLCLLLALSGVI